jgi:hypothetical protein
MIQWKGKEDNSHVLERRDGIEVDLHSKDCVDAEGETALYEQFSFKARPYSTKCRGKCLWCF